MSHWVEEGIGYLHDGLREEGERALRIAIKEDPRDVTAWLWLSQAITSDAEKITCLLKVLELDPHNVVARQKLAAMQEQNRTSRPEFVSPFKSEAAEEARRQPETFKYEEPQAAPQVAPPSSSLESPFATAQEALDPNAAPDKKSRGAGGTLKMILVILTLIGVAVIIGLLAILLK